MTVTGALLCAGALAACGSPAAQLDPTLGVIPSPKVAGSSSAVAAGGGYRKLGKPYKIGGRWYHPQEDEDYEKVGVASWYGKAFHGRRTANGETFDMHSLTAAHPTLPMPSYVRVTNLSNDRSVMVRINDRGPFSRSRVIDVSAKTAELLDFKRAGTARVRVEYVGPAKLNPTDHRYLMASYRGPGVSQSSGTAERRGQGRRERAPRYEPSPERNVLIASRTAGGSESRTPGASVNAFWPFGGNREAREERSGTSGQASAPRSGTAARPAAAPASPPRPATTTASSDAPNGATASAPRATGDVPTSSGDPMDALILLNADDPAATGAGAAEKAAADDRVGSAHAIFSDAPATLATSPTLDALTLVQGAAPDS